MLAIRENLPRAIGNPQMPLAMNKDIPARQEPSHFWRGIFAGDSWLADLQVRPPELKGKKRTVARFYVPARLSVEFAEDLLKKRRYPHLAESTRISDFDSNFRLCFGGIVDDKSPLRSEPLNERERPVLDSYGQLIAPNRGSISKL